MRLADGVVLGLADRLGKTTTFTLVSITSTTGPQNHHRRRADRLPTGINQVQVNTEIGMTFPAALRSILRQAPNIIMIGEIRDLETASTH